MIARHLAAACGVLLLALSACATDPEARLRFEDPSMRGSLMDFDAAIVPEEFQGLWATSTAACGDPREGAWLYVHEQTIARLAYAREQAWISVPRPDGSTVSSAGVWLSMREPVERRMTVTRVAGYSDDGTAILVDLALPDGEEPYSHYFEQSLDGFHMRVTGRGELEHTLYFRCP